MPIQVTSLVEESQADQNSTMKNETLDLNKKELSSIMTNPLLHKKSRNPFEERLTLNGASSSIDTIFPKQNPSQGLNFSTFKLNEKQIDSYAKLQQS